MRDGKERQAALRKRRQELGLRRCEYWLSPREKMQMDMHLKQIRKEAAK